MGTWTRLLITVGVTAWTLQVWTQSPKAYVLVVAIPPMEERSTTEGLLLSPWCKVRVGAPTRPPMMLGSREGAGFSFPIGATRDSGGGAALAMEEAGVINALLFLPCLHRSLLWPWCCMFQAHLPHSEFSPWCLGFEELLVFFWEGQKSGTVCVPSWWCHSQICFYMWYEMAGWG